MEFCSLLQTIQLWKVMLKFNVSLLCKNKLIHNIMRRIENVFQVRQRQIRHIGEERSSYCNYLIGYGVISSLTMWILVKFYIFRLLSLS